ncbi:MAG: hypothetical protein ACKOXB_03185 [Flavobacteriales bacterium]
MRQIFKNKYIKAYKFLSVSESDTFRNNQNVNAILKIDESYGDCFYSYVCHNSLTSEKEFAIFFSSDEKEDKLNFMFWESANLFVLDTGRNIYLLNGDLKIIKSLEIGTPLIGLYLTDEENLVLLEEASYRLVNKRGEVHVNELFDLIENFSLSGSKLIIKTSEGNKIFELTRT